MFTMTQNLQIAHQIQADRMGRADRHRRARRARRTAASSLTTVHPGNVVALRPAALQPAVVSQVA